MVSKTKRGINTLKVTGIFLIGVCFSLVAHAQPLPSTSAQPSAEIVAGGAQDDPIVFGHPLSYWINSIHERDENMEMAFDAIVELGPKAWRAVPELTRIVAKPFVPIRVDRDSRSELHAKLLDIHLRAGAVDGLGAIGEAGAAAAETVIRWGMTLRTVAPEDRPVSNSLVIELIGIDVLERMRAAGTVARFGPAAARPVQKLLESPDNEERKFSAAILNDTAVPIAAELMHSESCKDRRLGLSILSGMWPVVAREHLITLGELLEGAESEERDPTTINRTIPSSLGGSRR